MTITLNDYASTCPRRSPPGNHVIRVENAGPQPHEVVLVKLESGKSVKDIKAWEKGGERDALR